MERRGPSAYIAELIGTMFLVFAIGMAVSLNQVSTVALGYQDFAVIGLVHVFVLAMLVHTLGGTSGAHFNPAVTAAMVGKREIAPIDAVLYVVMQLIGAIFGALLVRMLLHVQGDAVNYGAPGYTGKFLTGNTAAAFAGEAIGTFLLVWAIFGSAVNPRTDSSWAPWIIGGTLGLAVMIIGPLTGGSFNPARAFGPALVGNAFDPTALKWFFVYFIGPIVGALAAGFGYTALAMRPRELVGERPIDKLES